MYFDHVPFRQELHSRGRNTIVVANLNNAFPETLIITEQSAHPHTKNLYGDRLPYGMTKPFKIAKHEAYRLVAE
jgi:hypothetical protein